MAEVTSRGGGLPRGAPHRTRGRGRGRGASNSTISGSHSAAANGLEHKINGHSSHPERSSTHRPVGSQDEPEELKLIRKKHGHNLATIKELFPNWTDEDLLMALNEAAGDLELAAARISEGLAEKWGSVKTKKEKKTSSPVLPSSQHSRGHAPAINSPAEGRGGRGRSDVPRGSSRGGGRGAAPRGVGRGQSSTNLARGTHPAADDPSIAITTPSSWSLAVTAPHNESTNPSGPSASLATIGNDLEQPIDLGITSQNVGALPPAEPKCETIPSQATHDANQNGTAVSELAKKPTSRVITPGTKMSWAQIARPVDPPKPPVAPVVPAPTSIGLLSGTDADSDVTKKGAPTDALAAQTTVDSQLHEGQVTISIPDATADVWHTEPVPAMDELKANISGTGPNVWNDDPVLQPLGVGEGWAEAVLAQPNESTTSIFDQQAASKLVLTPSDAPSIGPIELTTPSVSAPVLEPAVAQPTNVTDRGLHVPEPASILNSGSNQSNTLPTTSILAPPGLTKRASTRKGQDAAVVMPGSGTPTMDRMGLKFGSLSLFGEAAETGEASQVQPLDAPTPPVPIIEEALVKESSLKPDDNQVEKALTPQPTAEPVKSPSPPVATQPVEEHPAPPQLSHQPTQPVQHVQPQPINPPAAAPVQATATQPHSSSFNSRYQSNNQYAAPEPSAVQQPNATSQAPQPQQQDAFSHYSGFRQDPMAAYFQQQQQPQSALAQHSNSPVPASQSPAAYGTFNHMNQQVPQQSQQPAQSSFGQAPQSVPDYAAIYGQDALRSLGYYDSYAHAQAAQAAFQNRSPHGAADDSSKPTASAQTAPPPGQPQAGHHQHHHPPQQQQQQQSQPSGTSVSTAAQQYPGMQPSPMPYPYYPYYQQYGQLPPNYQNPAYPYALQAPSPYYSVQGSQQYQAANTRAGQSQYPMQGGPGTNVAAGPNSLPISHGHQQQHASQHGLGGAGVVTNNAGFRQVSQPGVGASQIPNGQVAGQGIGGGNSGLVGSGGSSGMPTSQQPSSMHQQHGYYGSGYGGYGGDPQQTQQGGGGMGSAANNSHHHHHHHQAQQQHVSRQSGHHQHSHHAGTVPTGASGGGQGANERKDPFTFASDRFFNQ
ncbi:hypothetical protein PGT21_031762 [Puccinia graminis f. sp. tritici]|uniref:RNA polymerase II degradation factor 1 n=1 Tax=Puccinia graminis f. sp. tritici TaxID=56615 RepID=A0A5B0QQF7_PUCGR|nr:hypothetical protein PGT21_031762 [Puccinia graminis f. sp. tritici]